MVELYSGHGTSQELKDMLLPVGQKCFNTKSTPYQVKTHFSSKVIPDLQHTNSKRRPTMLLPIFKGYRITNFRPRSSHIGTRQQLHTSTAAPGLVPGFNVRV